MKGKHARLIVAVVARDRVGEPRRRPRHDDHVLARGVLRVGAAADRAGRVLGGKNPTSEKSGWGVRARMAKHGSNT